MFIAFTAFDLYIVQKNQPIAFFLHLIYFLNCETKSLAKKNKKKKGEIAEKIRDVHFTSRWNSDRQKIPSLWNSLPWTECEIDSSKNA